MTSSLIENLKKISGCTVCVVGDIMLDVYIFGDTERISPEAPVPILKINDKHEVLGGAGNVVRNLQCLGVNVKFIGIVGDDESGQRIRDLLEEMEGVTPYIESIESCPTVVKTRFVSQGQQLLRVDDEITFQPSPIIEAKLFDYFQKALEGTDIVIVSDYNKGTISFNFCQALISAANKYSIPVFVDPKGANLMKYAGATLIKPNRKELSQFFGGIDISGQEVHFSKELLKKSAAKYCLLTLGQEGMILTSDTKSLRINAKKREVYDVTGAGDTVISALTIAYASGIKIEDAAIISNIAGGVATTKLGAAVVTLDELFAETALNKKELSAKSLLNLVESWRKSNLSIGFTNGCFDLIHTGHISTLKFCKENCDKLIVAINSDESVRRLKGPSRPVNDQTQRALVLSEFASIDAIIVFDEQTPQALIEMIKPDVLIKGGDYTPEKVVGGSFVLSYGGQVIISPYIAGFSSTSILSQIEQSINKR